MAAPRWFVVKTRVRQEAVAEENLRRQGYDAWLPLVPSERRLGDRWQTREEPLFPGYLFVQLVPGVQNLAPIRSTRGVSCLVSFAHEPAAMPEGALESLRQWHSALCEQGSQSPLQEGQPVQIARGAFAGLQGIFDAVSGEERVMILLQILGKAQSLSFARDDVIPT